MSRFIVQHRRGNLAEWQDYQASNRYIKPKDGELVIEYEEIYDTSGNLIKKIPRLKIGDGITDYDQLPYISIDSFILPTRTFVYLDANKWEQTKDENGNLIENRYYQQVEVVNAIITPNSKVDLQPSAEQLTIFHQKDLAFVTENDDGVVSVFCIGQKPTNDYNIQTIITEVET